MRLCDGLAAVASDEADTVIVAGMGGEVITDIIKNCEWLKDKSKTLILQPTTSSEFLREFLCKNGFKILSETPVKENNKLYSVILTKFTNSQINYPVSYYYIGEIKPTPEGILYIEKQKKRIFECMNALQNIKEKQNEYLLYKKLYEDIEKFLTESKNGT